MIKQTEALKLALEALENSYPMQTTTPREHFEAINAIREALAEQPAHQVVDSNEKAGAYMEARLWEFIDMAAAWPKASPDPRTWDHVMVYAPKPAQQEPIHVPVTDNTYGYAKSLAEAIFKQHFASDEHYASGRVVWGVNDTVIGILTQIDNMVADMVRRSEQPAQQEPVAWGIIASNTGRICQVELDADEVEGHNPKHIVPLYTSPPAQRKPLTDDEIESINVRLAGSRDLARLFARAIEAAHGIKENT